MSGVDRLVSLLRDLRRGATAAEGIVDLPIDAPFTLRAEGEALAFEAAVPPWSLISDGKGRDFREKLPPIPLKIGNHLGELRQGYLADHAYPIDDRIASLLSRQGRAVAHRDGFSKVYAKQLIVGPTVPAEEWRAELSEPSLAGCQFVVDGTKFVGSADDLRPCLRICSDKPICCDEAIDRYVGVLPLLRLAAPFELGLDLMWSVPADAGVASFGFVTRQIAGPLLQPQYRASFLAQAGATTNGMSSDERQVIRLLTDMLAVASGPDLEPSIFLMASAMELACHTWIEKAWLKKHPRASDRFAELLTRSGVNFDKPDVDAFAATRNKIAHGTFRKLVTEEKVAARYFGRWLLAATIFARLGYSGPFEDPRKYRIR